MNDNEPSSAGRSAVLLFVYWTVVGAPLAWGVYHTVLKVRALFN